MIEEVTSEQSEGSEGGQQEAKIHCFISSRYTLRPLQNHRMLFNVDCAPRARCPRPQHQHPVCLAAGSIHLLNQSRGLDREWCRSVSNVSNLTVRKLEQNVEKTK